MWRYAALRIRLNVIVVIAFSLSWLFTRNHIYFSFWLNSFSPKQVSGTFTFH
jgi:hypothetical protein